jgi:hypothetical protein
MNRIKLFEDELEFIIREDIRQFTEKALKTLPEYFFLIPASSSGKYHPSTDLGEGGLVRHSKAVARVAYELFGFNTLFNFTEDEKDMMISACILHDGVKNSMIDIGTQ